MAFRVRSDFHHSYYFGAVMQIQTICNIVTALLILIGSDVFERGNGSKRQLQCLSRTRQLQCVPTTNVFSIN